MRIKENWVMVKKLEKLIDPKNFELRNYQITIILKVYIPYGTVTGVEKYEFLMTEELKKNSKKNAAAARV